MYRPNKVQQQHRNAMIDTCVGRLKHGQCSMQELTDAIVYFASHEDEMEILDITREVVKILRRFGSRYGYSVNSIREVQAIRWPRYPHLTAVSIGVEQWVNPDVISRDEWDAVAQAAADVGVRHGWDLRQPDQIIQLDEAVAGLDIDLEVDAFRRQLDEWATNQPEGGTS